MGIIFAHYIMFNYHKTPIANYGFLPRKSPFWALLRGIWSTKQAEVFKGEICGCAPGAPGRRHLVTVLLRLANSRCCRRRSPQSTLGVIEGVPNPNKVLKICHQRPTTPQTLRLSVSFCEISPVDRHAGWRSPSQRG